MRTPLPSSVPPLHAAVADTGGPALRTLAGTVTVGVGNDVQILRSQTSHVHTGEIGFNCNSYSTTATSIISPTTSSSGSATIPSLDHSPNLISEQRQQVVVHSHRINVETGQWSNFGSTMASVPPSVSNYSMTTNANPNTFQNNNIQCQQLINEQSETSDNDANIENVAFEYGNNFKHQMICVNPSPEPVQMYNNNSVNQPHYYHTPPLQHQNLALNTYENVEFDDRNLLPQFQRQILNCSSQIVIEESSDHFYHLRPPPQPPPLNVQSHHHPHHHHHHHHHHQPLPILNQSHSLSNHSFVEPFHSIPQPSSHVQNSFVSANAESCVPVTSNTNVITQQHSQLQQLLASHDSFVSDSHTHSHLQQNQSLTCSVNALEFSPSVCAVDSNQNTSATISSHQVAGSATVNVKQELPYDWQNQNNCQDTFEQQQVQQQPNTAHHKLQHLFSDEQSLQSQLSCDLPLANKTDHQTSPNSQPKSKFETLRQTLRQHLQNRPDTKNRPAKISVVKSNRNKLTNSSVAFSQSSSRKTAGRHPSTGHSHRTPEEEERRKRRRERNKVAATKCRNKKKAHVVKLSEQSKYLETNNAHLRNEMNSLRRKERQLLQMLQQHNDEHCNLNKVQNFNSIVLQPPSTDDLLLTDSMEAANYYDILPEQQAYLLPTSESTQHVISNCTVQSPMIAQCPPSQTLSKSIDDFHLQSTDHQAQTNPNYLHSSNQINTSVHSPLPSQSSSASSVNARFSCNQEYSASSINFR